MPDPALSDAIREAYASAPVDEVIHHTLELWHPAFTAPIRVVRDVVALEARLEPGAARDPGAVVSFIAYAFDVVPPEQTTTGAPQCVIEIDNVSREILAQIDLAVASSDPVVVIYRAFLSSDLDSGPENDPPLEMTISAISATALRIRATAGFPDLLNTRFPGLDYDLERFPGLRATNNLSLQASRKIGVIATRKLPVWTGSSWTAPQASRSIAWRNAAARLEATRLAQGAAIDAATTVAEVRAVGDGFEPALKAAFNAPSSWQTRPLAENRSAADIGVIHCRNSCHATLQFTVKPHLR